MNLLTKTDFTAARVCPTKLYYRKNGYPSAAEGNDFLETLKDLGYAIGAMARLYFPEGILIATPNNQTALEVTAQYLQREQVTLFEAAFESNGKFARTDILVKNGNHLTLIEVKAASLDTSNGSPFRNKNGTISVGGRAYLDDVAFQMLLLREIFPHHTIACELMMVDKNRPVSIDNLPAWFHLQTGLDGVKVEFNGDAAQVRAASMLIRQNVDDEVADLIPEIAPLLGSWAASLNPLTKIVSPLGFKKCKECEYRLPEPAETDGFRECWGTRADLEPHVLDLYYGSQVRGMDELIANGAASLADIPPDALRDAKGNFGKRATRQLTQINQALANQEWIDPALGEKLATFAYPLHFIDFETTTPALPFHSGMCPYQPIAFQWSCHTLRGTGAVPEHTEWINAQAVNPNVAFVLSLMQHLERDGTMFMWAQHENSILSQIRANESELPPDALDWLEWITNKRLVDMNQLALQHYFHPRMKGSTSIKYVLDAVWQTNLALRERFSAYIKEENGILLSPYKALPPLSLAGDDITVQKGTEAIIAYQSMLYQSKDEQEKDQRKQQLLAYCKLDTLAMVMIYWHWQETLQQAV